MIKIGPQRERAWYPKKKKETEFDRGGGQDIRGRGGLVHNGEKTTSRV